MKHKATIKDWLKTIKYLAFYDFYNITFKRRIKKIVKLYKVGFITKQEFKTMYAVVERKYESHSRFMKYID